MDKLKRAELIEGALRCVSGICYKCPINADWKPENDCRGNMIFALATELEKADKIITVGSGQNYEVRNG